MAWGFDQQLPALMAAGYALAGWTVWRGYRSAPAMAALGAATAAWPEAGLTIYLGAAILHALFVLYIWPMPRLPDPEGPHQHQQCTLTFVPGPGEQAARTSLSQFARRDPHSKHPAQRSSLKSNEHAEGPMLVRIFSPIDQAAHAALPRMPFKDDVAECHGFVQYGAPAVVQRYFGWILDYWTHVETNFALGDAPPSVRDGPIIIFSHGNGASSTMYLGTISELVSRGSTSVDSSAGCDYVKCVNLSTGVRFDSPKQRCARTLTKFAQTSHLMADTVRSKEHPILAQCDTSKVIVSGHSFGGVTAQALAYSDMMPEGAIQGCLVIDPAMDWGPTGLRRLLLAGQAQDDFTEDCSPQHKAAAGRLDGVNFLASRARAVPTTVIYSGSWHASVPRMRSALSSLITATGPKAVAMVEHCTHVEQSDAGVMLPSFVSKALHLVGPERSPEAKLRDQRAACVGHLNYVRQSTPGAPLKTDLSVL
ncbi:uncharacterized protein MONBRDRAFT_12623 [Monosiga brevicollis MX1]|uniref:1-alkyl-2-acetylglycerophosphocholine esterase n=1 Tax=Monosiga brevicollis TaxID=81824 RepID=A9VCT9_MONBE|nr:uncharacterized protein MONBRDRAFT_12623 [Monosiga brevicollis MX1]EDQ84624.1 predicted protein [Monosiga brevicollis MX1]|eukprot:XP_001750528.1 hypothetical protein [Monosiga brevicollis MX1]